MVLIVVIVTKFSPLLLLLLLPLGSVVGNVPHQQELGAYAAYDGCVTDTHDRAAGRVGERRGVAGQRAALLGMSAGGPAGRLAGESGVEERVRGEFGKRMSGERGGGRR